MATPGLAPPEASKLKAEPARMPALKPHPPGGTHALPNFLSSAGNMAIQRAAAAPAHGNSAAILGGAAMSGGGCACGGTCDDCKKPVQRKAAAETATTSSGFQNALNRSGPGAALSSHTRAVMEHRFGHPFDDVRVHDDGDAADAAHGIQAHAFTMGRDIYFGRGRYQPQTTAGQKLIAHELTHVVQQRRGAVPPAPKSTFASHDDLFEREAEQAEAHVEREEHGVPAAMERSVHQSHSEPRHNDAVQRKCACGGTCSKCSATAGEQAIAEAKKPVQRKAEENRRLQEQRAPGKHEAKNEPAIQRKCACGGTCSKCSGAEEEQKSPVQRKAETTSEPAREKAPATLTQKNDAAKAESADNKSSRQKAAAPARTREAHPRLTQQAPLQRSASSAAKPARSARNDVFEREANAVAGTVAQGYAIDTDKLSASEHGSIQTLDWEWCVPYLDSDCTITSTAQVVAGETAEIAEEVWDDAKALARRVGGFLSYINNLLTITIPPMHLLGAHSFQLELPELGLDLPFLAGVVPIAEGVQIYGEVGLHLGLTPQIGLQLGPFDTHAITIAIHPLTLGGEVTGGFDLTIAGLLGAEARAGIFGEVGVIIEWPDPPLVLKVPLVHLEAGLSGILRGILADRMSINFHAEAGITGFDFELSQLHNLGAALDLGLAGYGALSVLGINLCTLYWPLYEAHKQAAIALSLDFGLSSLLGGAGGGGGDSGPSGGGDFGGGGASGTYAIGAGGGGSGSGLISPRAPRATLSAENWDDLGIEFQRDMHKDDCPLCDFLYELGLMPSQRGGAWTGHPKPGWGLGPLHVFPRNPTIKSGALCRGACGADCETCNHEHEHRECEETRDSHFWWVYPNYEDCGTHLGCRNHDACYDWCVDKYNEKGKLGVILGPCHRLCDFECICDYNLPQCVGWIGGGKPHDGRMLFSDKPTKVPGCKGRCPHKEKGKSGGESWVVVLPKLELFPRKTVAADPLDEHTKRYTIWDKHVWIPYVGLVSLEIYAEGDLHGELSAGLGPGTMENVHFDYDPHTGKYKAHGELRIPADFLATLRATGTLGADAKWFLVVKVASAKGTLRADAKLAGKATLILSGDVDVSCDNGNPTLTSDLDIPGCLELTFDVTAGFDIDAILLGNIFSRRWSLLSAKWNKCWGEDVKLTHTPTNPKIDLSDKTIKLTDLLEWLLSDDAEQAQPGAQKRDVKESPLTSATARTIPSLASQLDQTTPGTGTVTLKGGSSNTVGLSMMTRYLTEKHSPGSENTKNAQKAIYGFRKLPTRGAGAGNGFSDKEYIKGHLLNGKLGGLAEDENLFPITAAANHEHSDDVETEVKRLVQTQLLVTMYGVRVTGQNGPHDIDVLGDGSCTYEYLDANFECTYGNYTLYTDDTVELISANDKPIRSTFDQATFISDVRAKNCPQK